MSASVVQSVSQLPALSRPARCDAPALISTADASFGVGTHSHCRTIAVLMCACLSASVDGSVHRNSIAVARGRRRVRSSDWPPHPTCAKYLTRRVLHLFSEPGRRLVTRWMGRPFHVGRLKTMPILLLLLNGPYPSTTGSSSMARPKITWRATGPHHYTRGHRAGTLSSLPSLFPRRLPNSMESAARHFRWTSCAVHARGH